jgi:DNA invertase Pin-like site-specific DNA recombinase
MGRKTAPDSTKIKKIREILFKNPKGLWVREIARQTGLDKSTVSVYLSKYMRDEIEDIFAMDNRWIKIVRIKRK